MSFETRAGFVAILGRPNAGKSTLLNALTQERLAMVSHKSNATRKRFKSIVMHKETQIIFVDTPGLHHQEKLLNQFMLKEALRAMGDCDLSLFLAPATDSTTHYQRFLELAPNKKHILVLSKTDTLAHQQLLQKMQEYAPYQEQYVAIVPFSFKQESCKEILLKEIAKHLPYSPYLFDEELLTTENLRTIYKEIIRESIFEYTSDEIPYESDVLIEQFIENQNIDKIRATIVVRKNSQKAVMIGNKGETIKRIGTRSRKIMEDLGQKRVFLEIFVKVDKDWNKNKDKLREFGYNLDEE